MSLESCVGTRGWREGTERGGQWAEGASLHMAKPSPPSWPPAHGPQAPAVPSRPRGRSRCRPPNCRWGLRLSIRTLPRGRPPPPRSLFLHWVPALLRPVYGPLRPHLHGDTPALHGGEAVGQRQARCADPVPGALHRVGLGKVGTHGGCWPAASGAGEQSATRAGAGAGTPGGARGRSGPGGAATQGAGERREASQEAVTGLLKRGSGSGNGTAPDPARPARRGAARLGAAGSHFLSNSPHPRRQRPAQPPLPRDWRGHAHQRPWTASRDPTG